MNELKQRLELWYFAVSTLALKVFTVNLHIQKYNEVLFIKK